MKKAPRTLAPIFVAAAVLCLNPGCQSCSCENPSQIRIADKTTNPSSHGNLPGKSDSEKTVTPDSPDADLARHYEISKEQIAVTRGEHMKLPEIVRPADLKMKREFKTADEVAEIPIANPMPYRPDEFKIGSERVTETREFRIITRKTLDVRKHVAPQTLADEVRHLRKVLFDLKIPVFSRPVVLLDSDLRAPGDDVRITVGFPVPKYFKSRPGLTIRDVKAGRVLFANRIKVGDLILSKDVFEQLTSPEMKKLLGNERCVLSTIVVLDALPVPDKPPVGDGYFFCL